MEETTTQSTHPLHRATAARRIVLPGLVLGVFVALLNLAASASGTYTHGSWFWIVLGIELVAALWFGRLATTSKSGTRRIMRAFRAWASVLGSFTYAAVVIAVGTWLTLTLVTPDYADVFAELARQQYEAASMDAEQIDARVAEFRSQYRPHLQTGYVFVGTILTGMFFGILPALLAAVRRARPTDA